MRHSPAFFCADGTKEDMGAKKDQTNFSFLKKLNPSLSLAILASWR
jgi:hypothetical protein